jgi:hypothetical protein
VSAGFLHIGWRAAVVLAVLAATVIAAAALIVTLLSRHRHNARLAGYPSLGAYLRAAPRTDEEKRDAVDLALKGLVICLLGLLIPPLGLIGLFPFFYGTRKVVYGLMGLGIVDDTDHPAV